MSIPLSFGSNTIQVYAYEGFDYTIVNPFGFASLSNSSGLDPQSLYFSLDGSGNTRFSVSDLASTLVASSRPETFTVTATNGSSSVNTVTINPGRFLDPSRNTLFGNSYTFYKNEPIRNTLGYPLRLVAPSFSLKQPTSIPTLPPGLSFVNVASNIYDISGYPLVTVPNSNYQIIGVQNGGSKVVTTRFNMVFSNERIQLNVVNPLITNMDIGIPITPCVITSIPPIGTSVIRYSFPTFPDGITPTDLSGNTVVSPFQPSDSNYTLILSGTPTSKAAYAYKNAGRGASGAIFPITATRTVPTPLIETSQNVQLAFGETILFDLSSVPPLYVDVPLDSSSIFFRARSYFDTCDNIASITASSLPSGLSLNYTSGSDRAYVTGTPTTVSSGNYTIQAVNSNSKTRDYTVPITVAQDSVSFIPPTTVDVCFNFVLSRPVSSNLTGYYPSNIQFVAQAASRLPVTLSAPALAGTGLSLDSNGVITGIPTAVTPLTDLTVTATVTGSPAIATKTVKFAILNDQFTFTDVCANNFNFVENVAITPFQIPVTTLSGRNVIDFAQSNLPTGLSISPAGVISGTPTQSSPTSGNITITPTTGYASGSNTYPYTLVPDSILFTVPQDSYSYIAGQSVSIQVDGTSYSGTPVRNFALTLPTSYGLNISANTGLMGGAWTNSIPPNQVLPSSCNFDITAIAGGLTGTLPVSFTANPVLQHTSFVWQEGSLYAYNDVSWNRVLSGVSNTFDIVIKTSNVDGNIIMGTAAGTIVRSINAVDFSATTITSSQVFSELAFDPGSTVWWASGTSLLSGSNTARLSRTDDNGLTWTDYSFLSNTSSQFILPRSSNQFPVSPYLNGGIALSYKNGIMLAGGLSSNVGSTPSILRSTDQGVTWSNVTGGFAAETAYINTDHPTIWVATGSTAYKTIDGNTYGSPASTDTIKYSTDQGQTWSNASGGFTMFGYELVYANNTWVATGISYAGGYDLVLKYSTDGSNWTDATLFGTDPFSNVSPFPTPPLPLGSINYDGSNWNVFVQRQDASTNWVSEIYSSPDITASSGGWTITDVTSQFLTPADANRRFVSYTRPQWLRISRNRNIDILLSFNTGIGSGPTITSPSDSILLYQYVQTSIEVASSNPDVLFFISDEALPPGLDFNPLTGIISGKPAQQGTFQTEIYAKFRNTTGVTKKVINFTVNVPRVIRKQDGAGAYTSLLKQYTEVLAAQSARDNHVLPTQDRRLGEFMSPVPAAVTTAVLPKACLVCRRVECPAVAASQAVDAGEVITTVCDFIDANSGDVFDAGSAEANVCD